jgi:DNA polymerase-3 subunit epsilon
MKTLPFVFIDLETTGISPLKHEILEIGLVRAEQTGDATCPLREIKRLALKISPEHIENADPKALQINHYDPKAWEGAMVFKDTAPMLEEELKGHILVAQNVTFDVSFLERAYERIGKSLNALVYYHKLDLASLAMGTKYWDPSYKRFTLNELAERTGVVNTHAHSALADAVATFEIANMLLKRELNEGT